MGQNKSIYSFKVLKLTTIVLHLYLRNHTMHMHLKLATFTSLFILFSIGSNGQTQGILELEKRNGFKDIKLGMVVDSITGVKFKKDIKESEQYPAKLYTVENPEYDKIGEVSVNRIEVKTYNNLVYEISVVAHKDPRLMKALESLYGKSEYDIKNGFYFWKGETLLLKFLASGKNHLEMLYISYPVRKMMKVDKDKKVDDIANDF